ncbi:MAG: HAD hydrolase family protein [bacterium]|nr:HAD hydrolase family protein [bacterium]
MKIKNKRIGIDLDGTICENKTSGQSYKDVLPKSGASDFIQALKKRGCEIIIYTARNTETCNHNIGKINARQMKIICDWLDYWGIPYDEIWIKPNCEVFIDDKAIKFESWNKIKL